MDDSYKRHKSRKPPAEGERAAASGYHAQYLLAAQLILNALGRGTLEWIRIADPDAGRLDDFVIGTSGRVDAYQFKWETYPGSFTFNDLVKAQQDQPSLIAQLADGWTQLQTTYGDIRHVVVHLTTNQFPSSSPSATMVLGDPPPRPAHFAAFVEQAWKPVREAAIVASAVPREWQATWTALQEASGLAPDTFKTFVLACELDLGRVAPTLHGATDWNEQIHAAHLRDLEQFLFESVAIPRRIVSLSRDELLAELGWADRYNLRHRHEFPVDIELYEPVAASIQQLESVLAEVDSGYVAIIGTPGSGKSTLLTQFLRQRPERIVRYYAYVPDSPEPISLRGESESFLNDIVVSLRQVGFPPEQPGTGFDRQSRVRQFTEQLSLLHRDWQETGRKTILAIDGLDHIEREQHPSRSLLLDLPAPAQVPVGVVIVIGSQTDTVLPSQIQHSVQQPGRRVEMQPLSREAVTRILRRAGLVEQLTPSQMKSVYDLSSGHPLALRYLVEALLQAEDRSTRLEVLETTTPYDDTIAGQYHAYWRAIEDSDLDLAHLLGVAARTRRFLDLDVLANWYGTAAVRKLQRTAGQYFRRETASRWYFFHNSFRLFLIDATGPAGSSIDRQLHQELAGHCASEQPGSFWAWEELYHRAMAGEHATVLQRATPTYFREQAERLRPLDAVQADIAASYWSAHSTHDAQALARLVFAMAELDRRLYHLADIPLVEPLLEIGKVEVATEHVRAGNQLRVEPETALRLCPVLYRSGLIEEARRVLDLAEPVDLLVATDSAAGYRVHNASKLLRHWTEAAVLIYPVRQFIDRVRRLEGDPDWPHPRREPSEKAARDFQNSLLFHAGLELLRAAKWDDLLAIEAEFDLKDESDIPSWFWLRAHVWRLCARNGDDARARAYLEGTIEALHQIERTPTNPEERTVLADGILRILDDREQAAAWLEGVNQPDPPDVGPGSGTGMPPFLQRLELNRLLTALGEHSAPIRIIPDAQDPRDQGLVYFERAVAILARLWGLADSGQLLDIGSIEQDLPGLLRLFDRSTSERRQWTAWHLASQARGEFYAYLVHAIADHGLEAMMLLRRRFEQEWESNPHHWPLDVRRQIVLAFAECGAASNWVQEQLRRVASVLDQMGGGVPERLEEHLKQAEAWIAAGDPVEAERELRTTARLSFGPRLEEDNQLTTWAQWLGKVNVFDPTAADERIARFAQMIVAFDHLTEDSTATSASSELLNVVFQQNPQQALGVYFWLLDRHHIDFGEALSAMLGAALKTLSSPHLLVEALLRELVIPTATNAEPELMRDFTRLRVSQAGATDLTRCIALMAASIDCHAPLTTRDRWKAAIADVLREVGHFPENFDLDVQLHESSAGSSSSATLRLNDGRELTMEHVKMGVQSVADLVSLRAKQARGSHFGWRSILLRLAEAADQNDAETLATIAREETGAAKVLVALAERALALGSRSVAYQFAQEAFNLAEAYEWIPGWYYGGAKLSAARTMIALRGDAAREEVWDVLTADLAAGQIDYPRFVLSLDEILTVVDPDNIPLVLWPSVEDHLSALLSGAGSMPSPPEIADSVTADDSAERVLVDFLIAHIDHPVNVLRYGAKRALGQLVLAGDPSTVDAIGGLTALPESQQQQILTVLDAASRDQSAVLMPLHDAILGVSDSQNFAIRDLARRLRRRAGQDRSSDDVPSDGMLPLIYRMTFHEGLAPPLEDPLDLRPRNPLPSYGAPAELIRPFDEEYELVASLAGVAFEALRYRAAQLIPELRATDPWISRDEAQLMSDLDAANLRMTWRRPRATLARRALDHILVELVDAGQLDLEGQHQLDRALRWHDPAFVLHDPARRPVRIPPISGPDWWSEERGLAWVQQVSTDLSSHLDQLDDGRLILAEKTRLKLLEYGTPNEERRSATAPIHHSGDLSRLIPSDLPIARVFSCILDDYLAFRSAGRRDQGVLITENVRRFIDQPGTGWIALHPDIGVRLGWVQDPSGLFRWRDQAGNLMVESLWWKDGNLDRDVLRGRGEAGEGWLVVATQEAMEVIVTIYPSLRRYLVTSREYSIADSPEFKKAPIQIALL